jgi:hypothetical protein
LSRGHPSAIEIEQWFCLAEQRTNIHYLQARYITICAFVVVCLFAFLVFDELQDAPW